jgi:hypothetical protein
MYFITLPFLVRKIFTFYINDLLLFKCPFPEPKVKRRLTKAALVVCLRNNLLLRAQDVTKVVGLCVTK